MNEIKTFIVGKTEELCPELLKLSHEIHENPELGLQEFKACKWQKELMEKHGFTVTQPFCEMATAFKAVRNTGNHESNPLKIAFLSEYDALEGIGHGCGHNIIASCACGAAIALADAAEKFNIAAEIALFGTPAEETVGGKIPMAESGAFNGYSCALMIHPSTENIICRHGLAAQSVFVEFFGKAAHSSSPCEGINALSSMIALFNGINAAALTWSNESKINGIITDGGDASNVIPEYAKAAFTVRAGRKKTLITMYKDIEKIAEACASITGAKAKVTGGPIYAERYANRALGEAFKENMEPLGEKMCYPDYSAQVGSSDIGNVSLVVPAIHEYLAIAMPGSVISHHSSFRDAAISPRADKVVCLGAAGLAMTGSDVLTAPELRTAMNKEFDEKVRPNQC